MEFEDYSRTFLHFHTTQLPQLLTDQIKSDTFSLVDMGAGDGVLLVALELSGYLKNAHEVVAVDLSQDRCQRLREHTNFTVVCADVTHVASLESNSFDYAICTQVIEHVDHDQLLAEIKRILRPGGVLYVASVVKKWYGWWYYKTREGKWGLDPTHLREYSSQEQYEGVISNAGFKLRETKLTPLKLSIAEFLVRRILAKIYTINAINAFFLRHTFADFLRRKINIHPPGYFIIETVAIKSIAI